MATTAEQTARHIARRRAEGQARARARQQALLTKTAEAAAVLRRRGAKRVLLFGSLVGPSPAEDSDVDLAVEGLAGEAYFDTLAELMRLMGTRVDLVRLEEAVQSLRERIAVEGREL